MEPALKLLDPRQQTVFGMDYARHRNFTEIVPLQIGPTLRRTVPFAVELQNVPTRQQEAILWWLIRKLPNWHGGSIDATGPGQTIAEYTADEFGHDVIHQITLNVKWYAEFMPKMVQRFEDDDYDLPRDLNLQEDLRSVVDIDGIPRVPEINTKDVKDAELLRHGDFAIALALAEHAALNGRGPAEFMSDGRGMSRGSSIEGFLYG